ncbi:MAG TPA: T9SS type A sorting domain-containing protein, partial [Flavobacteriales bacterium]|nr:T9SS type A sorting domain-containing protein [Flavobacteriales bacterium]
GVLVTDANGCQDTVSVVLTEPPTALSGTTGTIDASCGVADGAAYVTAAGGTGAYTYLWDDPSTQTTDTAFNVAAGPYNVTVTDANTCTFIGSASVSDAGAPTATISNIIHISCFGANDGSAKVTATGGAQPYTYSWSTGGTDTVEVNMPGGTHSATVTDSIGCASVVNVTINEPAALTIDSVVAVNITCNGDSDGTITITTSGGTGVINYSIDGGSTYPSTTGIFTGLGAGFYNVSVQDSNGCTTTGSSLVIMEPVAVTISSEIATDATCNGANDGTITIVATGGIGTINYSIDSGSTYPSTTGMFTALAPGTYGVSVQDANGCTTAGSTLTVTEPSAISIDAEFSTNVLCNGGTDGTITITASGGVGTLSYSIDGGSTYPNVTGSFTGLSAGSYAVSVQDANGCTIAGSTLIITEPTALTSNTNAVPSNCGQGDGQASVAVFGGTAPFTYLWDDMGSSTTDTITGLGVGVYSVTVTDSSGCTSISTATITDVGGGTSSSSVVQDATCNGDCDGSGSVAITGGTSPFTYLWNDPAAQTTQTAVGLCAGTHSVDVTDANGCVLMDSVTIAEPALLTTTVTTTDATSGSCDGTATVVATGGTGSYTYLWDDPAAQTTAAAAGLCPGDASVTVTDGNGCTAVGSDSVGTFIGIVDIYESGSVNIYPNPNQGSFKVEYNLNSSEQVTISIYNKIGSLLMSYALGSTESGVYSIDMAEKANGIYYVQFTTASEVIIKKVSLIK